MDAKILMLWRHRMPKIESHGAPDITQI